MSVKFLEQLERASIDGGSATRFSVLQVVHPHADSPNYSNIPADAFVWDGEIGIIDPFELVGPAYPRYKFIV
jgi:hypothetical protein